MTAPTKFGDPTITRASVMLEIASELIRRPDQPNKMALVQLRSGTVESPDWKLGLYGSNSHDGIEAVVEGRATLAIVNPSAQLTLAHRGLAPYDAPQPVRTIGVIPSADQFIFAVRRGLPLRTFEDIGAQRFPLRVSMRAQLDHSLHFVLEHVMEAAGFSKPAFVSWGGELRKEGALPRRGSAKFEAFARGEIDAIFDEAVNEWLDDALELGATILPLSEGTVEQLEKKGLRRAVLEKRRHPGLEKDVLTLDFSGFPIFVHADAPDELVTQICAALEARKQNIPWEGEGPLPTARMCQDGPEHPMNVPLHPAAERFWRQCGFIT